MTQKNNKIYEHDIEITPKPYLILHICDTHVQIPFNNIIT